MEIQMKKYYLSLILLGVFNISIYANENIRFFWSFGDIGISVDNLPNKFEPFPFINVGNINWITKHGFGWGFHVFNVEGDRNWQQTLFLPMEINYSPFGDNKDFLFITLYSRGGWMVRFNNNTEDSFADRNGLFGAIGLRASWFPTLGEHWSIFTGAFIEYTSKNELRIGASLDTSVIVALATIAFGIALSDSESKNERNKDRDKW
jgi:hypothetical protein